MLSSNSFCGRRGLDELRPHQLHAGNEGSNAHSRPSLAAAGELRMCNWATRRICGKSHGSPKRPPLDWVDDHPKNVSMTIARNYARLLAHGCPRFEAPDARMSTQHPADRKLPRLELSCWPIQVGAQPVHTKI